ncbi:hypothetical protein [Cyanothece sp. BG0011]|uniref:hypothetical protein n=1 Tax=Cyanothece sp. BG0011 TaxID=2082950 RepID=UPI000D1E9B6E|nr:hypothetical protein [Cyanothece sp. BG0011]
MYDLQSLLKHRPDEEIKARTEIERFVFLCGFEETADFTHRGVEQITYLRDWEEFELRLDVEVKEGKPRKYYAQVKKRRRGRIHGRKYLRNRCLDFRQVVYQDSFKITD